MYKNKRVLLIAGGGTLGSYVAKELLSKGATVEIICPEEKESYCDQLIFHRSMVSKELLSDLFSNKHYDGIVNFIHYEDVNEYKEIHPLLIENTDHLIFLSTYRVYANESHPVTEEAPRLLDVIKDDFFLNNENYAVPKAKAENYLRSECKGQPWTIVRPVISFSQYRIDLLMYSGDRLLRAAERGEELLLPELVRNYKAGLDWAGNSGKIIANLLFKPEVIGEAYTIYSGQGLTWGEIAEIYEKLIGLKVRWCKEEEYLKYHTDIQTNQSTHWGYWYDRRYNRDIVCSKVLKATGLTKDDFSSIEDGIKIELKNCGYKVEG